MMTKNRGESHKGENMDKKPNLCRSKSGLAWGLRKNLFSCKKVITKRPVK